MKKYILIYHINNYRGNVGGVYTPFFDTLKEMDKHVNDIMTSKENVDVLFSGLISKEFEYKTIEKVTKYESAEKKYE